MRCRQPQARRKQDCLSVECQLRDPENQPYDSLTHDPASEYPTYSTQRLSGYWESIPMGASGVWHGSINRNPKSLDNSYAESEQLQERICVHWHHAGILSQRLPNGCELCCLRALKPHRTRNTLAWVWFLGWGVPCICYGFLELFLYCHLRSPGILKRAIAV